MTHLVLFVCFILSIFISNRFRRSCGITRGRLIVHRVQCCRKVHLLNSSKYLLGGRGQKRGRGGKFRNYLSGFSCFCTFSRDPINNPAQSTMNGSNLFKGDEDSLAFIRTTPVSLRVSQVKFSGASERKPRDLWSARITGHEDWGHTFDPALDNATW